MYVADYDTQLSIADMGPTNSVGSSVAVPEVGKKVVLRDVRIQL